VTAPALLVDSSIIAYALGAESAWKDPCRELLLAIGRGEYDGFASVEMIQELVHHRLRVTGDRLRAVADGRDVAAGLTVLPFTQAVLDEALRLIESSAAIRGRDAVHAATALVHGIPTIASTDPAFDAVPGLTRLVPTA